jgi:pilus assembly protein CpaC
MRACTLAILSAFAALAQGVPSTDGTDVTLQVNRSTVIDLQGGMKRISVASGDVAEAVAVSSKELLVNGKAAGDTSLLIWDMQGVRHTYLVHVIADPQLITDVRENLAREVGPGVSFTVDGPMAFLQGVAPTAIAADRATAIVGSIPGVKLVNLLRVTVPDALPQILLKVRFADYDRSQAQQFGINLFALNGIKGIGNATTGQYGAPPAMSSITGGGTTTLTDFLNILYFRPDLNLGVVLQDLAAKNVIQILAEPDLLALSGHQASFLAGGEFPFPTIQGGGSGVGQITIQFKEFGIRLNFVPTVTPRGTIHLKVMPEVSSLDYSNGLTVSGFTVPALSTKRVTTEVELDNGQSFAIAGLLDNQLTENLDRLPGFANIPVLGKLFTSRSYSRSNSELLIVVTPELVRPLQAGQKGPLLDMPKPFMPGSLPERLSNPTDPGALQKKTTLTVEELKALVQAEAAASEDNLNPGGAAGGGASGPSSPK